MIFSEHFGHHELFFMVTAVDHGKLSAILNHFEASSENGALKLVLVSDDNGKILFLKEHSFSVNDFLHYEHSSI